MKKEVLDFAVGKTKDLMGAVTCSSETKAAAQSWLDSIGTDREAEETKKYVEELEADIMPIETLIQFAQSDGGSQVFGEQAGNVAAHAKEIQAAGGKFCDCPACVAVAEILEKKEQMLQ